MEERMGNAYRRQKLERHFEPVAQSNEHMVKEIKNKTWTGCWIWGLNKRVETYSAIILMLLSFGIRFEGDGKTYMGDKLVEIENNHLIVDEEVYERTPGVFVCVCVCVCVCVYICIVIYNRFV